MKSNRILPTFKDKITLIVPSFNRQEYLLNLVSYWKHAGIKIIIVDGCFNKISVMIINALAENITYYHLPEMPIEDRLIFAGSKVETEYVAMMCDDECISENGIEACIRVLDADKSLDCCGGLVIGFRQNDGVMYYKRAYSELLAHNALSDSPYVRLIESLALYTPSHIFGVNRTSSWTFAMQCAKIAIQTGRYGGEIAFEMISSALGKFITIPIVCVFRNYNNIPIREIYPDKVDGGELSNSFAEWWNSSANKNEKKTNLFEIGARAGSKVGR